jgi:superfamily II DNA or RNA helicase
MQIIDNKALVLRTRDPNKYAIIPKSQVVNETNGIYEIAVRWGLDEVRVLRNLGVRNVPSPITAKYDWPGRFNPMSHQVETAAFLTMHKRAFVFSEPGTGKTLAALWTAINNIDTEVIHGDVSVTKRTRIFKQFQEEPDPRVLVIQPQAAAHGVTLTAADTVVFWGPVMSTETYIQCCARSDRKGQNSDKVTIIHIQGSEIERKMFTRLAERVDDNNMLVKLYEEVLDMK